MARFKWVGLALLLLMGWSFVGDSAAETGLRIQIVGSTTVLPVVSHAAQQFMASSNTRILVNAGGSGVGIFSAAQGRADIGMASREISSNEKKRFKNSDLKTHSMGLDAVACMVSSEIYQSGVRLLTRAQIAKIYMGKITNWKEVGGPDKKIVVIDKEHHRGTRHVFMRYVFGNATQRTPGTLLVTGSNNEEQTKIAQSDSAIGMLSFAWINEDVRAVIIQDQNGKFAPTLKAVQSGRYPIMRELSLITRGEPKGKIKAFIDFVKGPEGQKSVVENGYIPVGGETSKP